MFQDEYQAVCNAGKNKLNLLEKNPLGYFVAAMLAGMFIGFGAILQGLVSGYLSAGSVPSTKLIGGIVFSVGLTFVVMAGAELFTGNNFVMSAASFGGAVPWGKTIKLWVVCYIGNFVGSIITAALFYCTGIPNGEPVGTFFGNLAQTKMSGSVGQLFAKAIMCNICVCIAIWCSIKCKTEGAKIAVVFCAVTTFVTCGFEHSVANMTYLTIGMLAPNGAAVSLAGYFYNLAIVTLGNMVGGICFIALPYYLISRKAK